LHASLSPELVGRIQQAKTFPIDGELSKRGIQLKKIAKNEFAGRCPVCGGTDRFSINIVERLFNCRGCKKGGDIINLVRFLDGSSLSGALETIFGTSVRPQAKMVCTEPSGDSPDHGVQRAREIWQEAGDPHCTLVEIYLAGRKLRLIEKVGRRAIRFHPALYWREDETGQLTKVPAMIAAMVDIYTNELRAIQRTALRPDGTKIGRKMMGQAKGTAIKLSADEEVVGGLGIAEGFETALAVAAMGWRPVWALCSARAVEDFPMLTGIESLSIFTDHDPAGIKAAAACSRRWEGFEVTVRIPRTAGHDFNDAGIFS
jgi:phage/plasmid primase-like uncharacterized protein